MLAVKVQNHPRLEHLKTRAKKKKWHYVQFLSKHCTCHWLSCRLAETRCIWRRRRGVAPHLSPPSLFRSSFYLFIHIGWEEFIIRCEGAAHDKHTSSRVGPLYHLEWMNDLPLTQPGEENTCSAGLGWLATCWEGWEFLQQERWRDGGMGKVEEEEKVSWSPCVCSAPTLTWRGC